MSALRTTAAVAGSLLLALLTTAAGNGGVRPGTAEGAELVKTGWWWAANETPLDETVVAPPQPNPPNVPKGTLPVSAAGGEPEKFTALEFRLAGEPGGFVESAVLVLRENADAGATVNAEAAKILACPVTETFWADGASAAWKARPAYDCDLASAAGERDARTGLWKFDLTAVAALWTAEGYRGSTSVALVEGTEGPESFQVAFDGPAKKGIGFAFVVDDAATAPAFPPTAGASSGGASGAGASGSAGSSGSSLSGSLADSGTGAAGPLGTPEASAAEAADPTVAPVATAATVPASSPVAAPAWYSGIPAGGYALLVLALALGYLVMLALGPDAQPAAGPARHGVSRALDRLRTVGAAMTTRGRS
ncbi:MAG TPA: hypothetical protein VFJ83_11960 [Nocardioidaceae bacterium]|nr:hypothetical protein [Nocardioidaceae bacterium]